VDNVEGRPVRHKLNVSAPHRPERAAGLSLRRKSGATTLVA
jgi:hypothetical protein